MKLFTWNSPYYHFLKYLLFLLKHPVYIHINTHTHAHTHGGELAADRGSWWDFFLFRSHTQVLNRGRTRELITRMIIQIDYQLYKYLPLPILRNLSLGLSESKKWAERP